MLSLRLLTFTALLSLSPSIFPCNYSDDLEMQAKKAQCIGASKKWDCRLNRCMTTWEAFQMREEFRECEQLTGATAKKECFLKLAEKKSELQRNARPEDSGWETLSVGLSSAYALMGAISWYSKDGGGCLSKKIMMGGSAAHLSTHFLVLKQSKKKFDDIAARAQSSNNYNAQLQAFHLLKEEQEAIKKYAKKKKITYTIVAASYAGALATSVLETGGSFGMSACQKKPQKSVSSPPPSQFARILSKSKNTLSIKTSKDVALYSGIGMGLAYRLRSAAAEEEQKSERNIAHLNELIAKFGDTIAVYCPQGREDLKKPRCYCYTDKGEPSPKRTKSAICQKLWKKDNINYAVKPDSYDKRQEGRLGCMTTNGQFDSECRCRKYKNSATGKNLCLNTSQHIVIPSALGPSLSGAGEALKAADILTGASNKANFNTKALNKAAAQTKRYADKLLKSYNRKSPPSQSLPISPQFVKKAVNKLVDTPMRKSFGTGSISASSLASSGKKASPAIANAIKTLQQKKLSTTPSYQKNSQRNDKKKGSNSGADPFNWAGNTPARTAGKTLHLKGTDSLYKKQKNADLHTNPDTNIWKVLSNRYQNSGILILFKENQP